MGKKQVRQVRQQMRKVQPKAAASNAQGATRKQRERFVQAGGMLQGYSPDYVIRIGYISIAVAVVCVLIIAACLVFLPGIYGWPDAVAAAVAWVFPIALLASFVDFSLHRSIACVFFFPVSPPLQPTISCAGILCSTFADTTSDRSALRT